MTEMITIIAVGIGLAGLILNGQKNAREDTKSLEARLREGMNARFDQMDERFEKLEARLDRMDARFERLEARMGTMERQQAKLEGLLEGLREAISGRAPASR